MVHAYKFLNLSAISEFVVASTTTNFQVINSRARSLYDLMETDDEMVLSLVKEQLNHYIIRKVSDKECKSLLAWWKVHES